MKKIISASILLVTLFTTVQPTIAFKHMDICNETNGDSSGDYYDGKCNKEGSVSEVSEKKVNSFSGSNNKSKSEVEYKFKHKLTSSIEKIHYTPFWLSKDRNKTKDEQLCKISSSFEYINILGKLVTYLPQGCQVDKKEDLFDNTKEGSIEEDNSQTNTLNIQENNSTDNLLEDIFNAPLEEDQTLDTQNDNTSIPTDTSTGTGLEDVDELFNDLFSLKGNKLAPTIKEFAKAKLKVKVGNISANFIKNENSYNETMAQVLNKVDNEFNIDSIKNDFAKNVSNLSYSLYTYSNTSDEETKKVFEQKLKRDIYKIKKKYKTLKFKDKIISKAIAKRNAM